MIHSFLILSHTCIFLSLYSYYRQREALVMGRCVDARERVESGQISCDENECPPDCGVCTVCLGQIPCDAPTPSPTVVKPFDLANCETYDTIW